MLIKYCCAIILILCCIPSLTNADEKRSTLPVIREIWLDAQSAPSILGSGSWSIVPRKEFEIKRKLAEVTAFAERQPPWLVQANYHAQIDGLIMTGTADLQIHNPHQIASWTTLSPWSMPLQAEQSDHVVKNLRSLSNRSLSIRTTPTSTQNYKLTWQLQGEERSDGKWFQLQLPPCPQAVLNITIPFPYRLDWPSARQHMRGPFPVEGSSSRRWQLQLGGESRQDVLIVLRLPSEQRQVSWTEARVDADFFVTPQEVTVNYEMDIHRWHNRLRSLTLDLQNAEHVKRVLLRQPGSDLPLKFTNLASQTIDITLPESVDQRATIILEAAWPHRSDERITFPTPWLKGVASLKPTIRIVTSTALLLADWRWGDFTPIQMAQDERHAGTPAEILTLQPRIILKHSLLQAPSARQWERSPDLSYQQDAWWHIGRQSQQLTVRCQCVLSQGSHDVVSWTVPQGWKVSKVTADPALPHQGWTWHPGRPLEIYWPTQRRTGEKCQFTITLHPETPAPITVEPRVWFMPNLVPLVPGRFTGSYAVTLERQGELLPPSLAVVKDPGSRATPPISSLSLWATHGVVSDLYWSISDAAQTGSIQIQDWPATCRASLQTQLVESENDLHVKYHVKIQPLAGSVTHWPATFATEVSGLAWESATKNYTWVWKQKPFRGELQWPEPLDRTVELTASLPWKPHEVIPLISTSLPFEGRLRLSRFWNPSSSWSQAITKLQENHEENSWYYDSQTSAPKIERQIINKLELGSPCLETHLHGVFADNIYSTTIPPHPEQLILELPAGCKALSCELDNKSIDCKTPLLLPTSVRSSQIRIRYRTAVHNRPWATTWQQVMPLWNIPATTSPICSVNHSPSLIPFQGPTPGQQASPGRFLCPENSTIVLISRSSLMSCCLLVAFFCLWLTRRRTLPSNLLLLAMVLLFMGISLWNANFQWSWWIFIAALIGIVLALLSMKLPKRLPITIVSIGAVTFTALGSYAAVQQESVVLVYVLRSSKDQRDDDRVMVPASLWQNIQQLAKTNTAGEHQRWWISQATADASLNKNTLKLISRWMININGNEEVNLPWLDNKLPAEWTLDGQSFEPRLVAGPFGLQSWSVTIKGEGFHQLKMTQELPIKLDGSWKSIELKWPGALIQQLTFHNPPAGLQIAGSSGGVLNRQIENTPVLLANVGLAQNLTISWPSPDVEPVQAIVDTAVLWELRTHQITAHALLDYHVQQGILDTITVELPAGLRLKNLSLIGDLQTSILPRIKQWRIEQTSGKQVLHVNLQRPVAGTLHLLMELPYVEDSTSNILTLNSIQASSGTQRHHIIAYLADGLLAEPLTTWQSPTSKELEFARPWLPSLSSLPASAIAQRNPVNQQPMSLKLNPLPTQISVATDCNISLNQQGVQYRYQVKTTRFPQPLIYLQGNVAPGMLVNSVSGPHVIRWFQASNRPGEASQLSIWLKPETNPQNIAAVTIDAIPLVHFKDDHNLRIPIFHISWDQLTQDRTHLRITSKRSGKINAIQWPGLSFKPMTGPWLDPDLLVAGDISQSPHAEARFILQEDNSQSSPLVTVNWDLSQGQPLWVQTLLARPGDALPAELEMLAISGTLEQNWQFDAGVPLAYRASRTSGSGIKWSLQMSKPVNRIQIKCSPLRDEHGNWLTPNVTFPSWPDIRVESPPSPKSILR